MRWRRNGPHYDLHRGHRQRRPVDVQRREVQPRYPDLQLTLLCVGALISTRDLSDLSLESSSSVGNEEQSSPSSFTSPTAGERTRFFIDRENLTVPIRPSSRNREASLTAARTQKCSMSVQDRSSRGRRSNVSPLLNPHHQPTQSREEYDLEKLRSSSSLSGRFPSGKMGLGVSADRERERLTATEWLGPRTVKVFSSRAHGSRSRAGTGTTVRGLGLFQL